MLNKTQSKFTDAWKKVWDVPSHTKSAAQRHLAILALGSMQALRHKRITVRQAWDNGLNFKTYLDLKNLNADRRLLEMWEWAMELPQVAKLGQAVRSRKVSMQSKPEPPPSSRAEKPFA